jgi:hypothetical protein
VTGDVACVYQLGEQMALNFGWNLDEAGVSHVAVSVLEGATPKYHHRHGLGHNQQVLCR